MRRYFYFFLLLSTVLAGGGCTKVKQDVFFDKKDILNNPASSIRIYNFTNGPLNISVNNVQLTAFVAQEDRMKDLPTFTQIVQSFFPGTGLWYSTNTPLVIPSTFLDKNSKARIYIVPGYDNKTRFSTLPEGLTIDTVLQHDPLHPVDYFLLSDGKFKVMPRSIEAPIAPDHFKIRILNFGAPGDTLKLGGPVSLTYADGTPVAPALNNVVTDSYSDYTEVPYGSYQFKLFVNGNKQKQLVEPPAFPYFYVCSAINPAPQSKIFPTLKTFKPGGTYSVIVTKNAFRYNDCSGNESTVDIEANAYRIVTENSPPLNISYARAVGINALTDQDVVWKMDGQGMGVVLGSGKATEPAILITGVHRFSAYDGKGKLLVEKEYNFSAADYISVWVYSKEGQPDILFTTNNMTASQYNGNVPGDDGTDGSRNIVTFNYAWQSRFLNLSDDIPYITFTNQDGESFARPQGSAPYAYILNPPASYQNLERGKPVEKDPFIIIECINNNGTVNNRDAASFANMPSLIRVFQSTPGPFGQTPGNWLSSILPLKNQDFIAMQNLYETGLPETETGVYSVALIGKLNGAGPQKARLIFIKHNK